MTDAPFIQQTDPKANYVARKSEIDAAVLRALESGWYILGKETEAFEKEFARYLGAAHAIGVNSGTDALHLALRACGIGLGDSVLTVSHTAVATVAAIELTGAKPVLVDIDPDTYTMSPESLKVAIQRHDGATNDGLSTLKAVVVVHLYGHPADMPALLEIARQHNLCVVEDCAQSHGATLDGKMTGTWGDIAAFSFYPTKNLGALGDGGAVVTDQPDLAEKTRLLREYGWRQRYISDVAGMNSRLDELQSAILRVKLKYLAEDNARRREIARRYDEMLSATSLVLPKVKPGCEHVYHQYVIRTPHRDHLRDHLKNHGIGALIHYPAAVHQQPAYHSVALATQNGLSATECACREILSLPMHAQLTDEQVARVVKAILDWVPPTEGKR
jgi:dTDP-4-amino-4,6-dideoxygalactose transaminase